MGPFEGKKVRKSRTAPKKWHCAETTFQSRPLVQLLENFWLKQGLEPVTAGFTENRVKSTKKWYIHDEVCGVTKREQKN